MPRPSKSQATSSKAAFGASALSGGFGANGSPGFGTSSSSISYLAEQPDLSSLSDPNISVHFKNLSKKDNTTKARALDELQTYVSRTIEQQQPLEDAFLDAWVKVYPRASIDLSRRVRQTAHAIQGSISSASGKRMAKHLPLVVPSWLAGLHDGDSGVMRSARDALQQTFQTPEKQLTLKKAYQQAILAFCSNAVNHETSKTLSDERSTTSEDADAIYARVIFSTVSAVTDLIRVLEPEELDKQMDLYDELVRSDRLWALFSSKDPQPRRAVMRLLRSSVAKLPALVDAHVSIITKAALSKSTMKHQTGSAVEYVELLRQLTQRDPALWSRESAKGRSSEDCLQGLVKYGAHGGPAEFWAVLKDIMGLVPSALLPSNAEQAVALLNTLRDGLSKRDEQRSNYPAALDCYFATLDRVAQHLKQEDREIFVQNTALPVIMQYLKPSNDSKWNVPAPVAPKIFADAVQHESVRDALVKEWPSLADSLVQDMKTSLPEQSRDFDLSQREVEAQCSKFFSIRSAMSRGNAAAPAKSVGIAERSRIVEEAIDLLKARNGKPFGAAGCVAAAMEDQRNDPVSEKLPLSDKFDEFLTSDLPGLLMSPSQTRLISILYRSTPTETLQKSWTASVDTLLSQPDSSTKSAAIQQLLASKSLPAGFRLATEHDQLQHFIVNQCRLEMEQRSDDAFTESVLDQGKAMLSERSATTIMSLLAHNLGTDDRRGSALSTLLHCSKSNNSMLRGFVSSTGGSTLLQNLLAVQESATDSDAASAQKLVQSLKSSLDASNGVGGVSFQEVLDHGLYEADERSLAVDTLIELSLGRFESDATIDAKTILPDTRRWSVKLRGFLESPPKTSGAITSQLGGIVYLIEDESRAEDTVFSVDAEGLTSVVRMAMYTVRLIERASTARSSTLASKIPPQLYCNILLTALLVDDKLGDYSSNHLWTSIEEQTVDDLLELSSSSKRVVLKQIESELPTILSQNPAQWPEGIASLLWQGLSSSNAVSFHHARAFSTTVDQSIDSKGYSKDSIAAIEEEAKSLKKNGHILAFASFLIAFQIPLSGSAALTRIVNESIAELTSIDPVAKRDGFMRVIVPLNLILRDHESALDSVAKQRLIFATKNLITVLRSNETSEASKQQTCKALEAIYPHLIDIYAEFWAETIESLTGILLSSQRLTAMSSQSATVALWYSTLKLLGVLRSISFDEEANDDVKEAWSASKPSISSGLLNLVKKASRISDGDNQPLRIMNQLLSRMVAAEPSLQEEGDEELYALLNAESLAIQQTAFEILHRQIPKAQEDISLAAALDKKTAKLPEELLSLLMQAPPLEAIDEQTFDKHIPFHLLTYLSSWLLLFDHFKNASEQVKSDYKTQIKEGGYLADFLMFMSSFLGHSRSKPIDASKFDPSAYSFGIENEPLKDARWLLIHLYFLCLKRLPGLTKSWWIDCPSRQIRSQLGPWTEKHFSPLVIGETLDTATVWASKQSTSAEDYLEVKSNARTREVRVAKDIDDQQISIIIRLPSDFPLGKIVVDPGNRVAVDERRWRSWLLNTAGVIAFSDNSIPEGMMAFQRNVMGQLKGQTECAICYSIVSQDKQLPTKKCVTCKNAFHGSCLYRWFKSSNSSSCPLCRTEFNYAS